MQMEEMVLVSVDDHITEPGDVFDGRLSGEALATAPQLKTTAAGTNYWAYQELEIPAVGLNAVVGPSRWNLHQWMPFRAPSGSTSPAK